MEYERNITLSKDDDFLVNSADETKNRYRIEYSEDGQCILFQQKKRNSFEAEDKAKECLDSYRYEKKLEIQLNKSGCGQSIPDDQVSERVNKLCWGIHNMFEFKITSLEKSLKSQLGEALNNDKLKINFPYRLLLKKYN